MRSCAAKSLGTFPRAGKIPQKNKEEKSSAFKHWISEAYLQRLAKAIRGVKPDYDTQALLSLKKALAPLELKARVNLVSETLHATLEKKEATAVLLKAVRSADLSGFDLWPITHFIERYKVDDFNESMDALHELTQRFTAEFAIRPFLIRHEKQTLARLSSWATDKSHHVRRLVSEGSRPRLPWGSRLPRFIEDPGLTIKLLEKLKYDPELYVRKSVANHLNDIAKDHPDIVVTTLLKWNADARSEENRERIRWITKHALRSLIKSAHPGALKLMGVKPIGKSISVSKIKLTKNRISLNQHLEFAFEIKAKTSSKLIVDYVVHHRKSGGGTSEKVFKLKTIQIKAGESLKISKRHPVKVITTRKYYAGDHWIEIQVNGKRFSKARWVLG